MGDKQIRYLIWDLETTIHTSFKRKANPFDPNNFVVMQGYRYKGGPIVGDYYGRQRPDGSDWFRKLLEPAPPEMPPELLVGVNIKFDILYAIREPENHAAWMRWITKGGQVWDCQLAEYLLEGMAQSEHMLSMDEIAPRYGGNTKFDEVKALWEAGWSTEEIDPDLLRRYLCGDDSGHGDIGNTEVIYLAQLQRAKASGQLKSIELNMGSLVCTTEMELNGMAVDVQLGMKQAEKLAIDLAELISGLVGYLPKDLPYDFSWTSGTQKSALIFGGTVKYKKKTPDLDENGKQIYVQKEVTAVMGASGRTMELNEYLERVAKGAKDSALRYVSGKREGEYKTKKIKVDDLSKPKIPWREFEYTFPRITEPDKRWALAAEGVWSTSADVIKALANRDIPFLKQLGQVEAVAKDLGTYYITTDEKGVQKGMLTLVQATGIIHHKLNHTSTVTARFSSSDPNLQNLPTGQKSLVKSLFVSRFANGKIIQSDFTALEVYVQAVLTRCDQLIEDLKAGLDMHCVRVANKEGCTYEEALLWCKGTKEIPPRPGWPEKRKGAKEFSFQRAYGAGAPKISESTGIPIDDVKALIVVENQRYPEIELYYENLTQIVKDNSESTNKFAAHPDLPHLTCNFRKSHFYSPDGKRYSLQESASPEFLAKKPLSKGGCTTSFSPTEIKNYIVQGSGGEWAKAAMWLAVRVFYRTGNFGGKALLVNQVHDALYVDADDSAVSVAGAALHACMEAASGYMEYLFDWEVPVPVPSVTEYGPNMLEESHMPEGHEELTAKYSAKIYETYMGGYRPSFKN